MRPNLTARSAARIAFSHFDIDLQGSAASELPSTADRNFRLGDAVLKIVAIETGEGDPQTAERRRQDLELETRLMRFVSERRDLDRNSNLPPTPRLHTANGGSILVPVEDDEGRACLARLIEWMPGSRLSSVAHGPRLWRNLGRAIGALGAGLEDFDGGAQRPVKRWDLLRATEGINRDLGAIEDVQLCRLVEDTTSRFVRDYEPQLDGIRRGWIHGDINDDNVLVAALDDSSEELYRPSRITGLLDFGDVVHSAPVCELAIAATYLLLDGRHHRRAAPLRILSEFVRSYHQQHPLTEAEAGLVFPLVLHRLCFSLVRSARARGQEPENVYAQTSAKAARSALERLGEVHPRRVEWTVRHACGYEPVPGASDVAAWLQQRRCAPVLGVDLDRENTRLVDLSLTNPDFAGVADPADEPSVTRWASERLGVDLGAPLGDEAVVPLPIGWGRYDEPRLVYAGSQFGGDPFAPRPSRSQSEAADLAEDAGEQRTIHLGVDLFAPSGTAIYAPLEAVVYSVADNDEPFDYGGTVILEHSTAPARFFTLYGHLDPDSLHHLAPGEELAPGDLVGRLGAPNRNGGWTPHLHLQLILDLLDDDEHGSQPRGNFPGVAPASERELWKAVNPDPAPLITGQRLRFPEPVLDPDPVRARRLSHLSPSLSLSYDAPLLIVRGKSQYLYDQHACRYLDLVNNVCHVGHAHPRVVEALHAQAALLNTNTRYLHPTIGDYAERLLMRLPESLEVCFFVNSGSEANDLALRLAHRATGREALVCLEGAYHGHTRSLIDVSPYKHGGPGGSGTPARVTVLPLPDIYRGPFRGEDAAQRYAHQARERIAGMEQPPAAVIAESLLGCGGQIPLPEGYLPALFEAVHEQGGVCIADEVQIGFGRVGSHFWGFQHAGATPDIVTAGKPMGNGHPLAAVFTTREIAEAFDNGMEYFNTFGGNPVSCAVGAAVLDVLEEENLQRRAWELGELFTEGLRSLQQRYDAIGDVRGPGLFIGVELVADQQQRTPAPRLAAYVVERMRERGVLLSVDGPQHNVLKIKPPLVLSRTDIENTLRHLDRVLAGATAPTKVDG